MTAIQYRTAQDVLNNIQQFIQDKLAHVSTTLVQNETEKETVYKIRSQLIDQILLLLNKLGLNNKTAATVCGIDRGLLYYMKNRMYDRISTQKCEVVLKHLTQFAKDTLVNSTDACVVHHRFLRQEEKVEVCPLVVKEAAFKEANQLLVALQLSARAVDLLNKGFRGSVDAVRSNHLANISLRRVLELLQHLRGLVRDGYQSEQSIKLSIDERAVVFQSVQNKMTEKKLTPYKVEEVGICHKRDIYYIQARHYHKISLKKAKGILAQLETF